MDNITCLDSAGGNELQRVTQWDKSRSVYIGGIASGKNIKLYFCNHSSSESTAPTTSYSNGYYYATIPNELLQNSSTIICYVVETNGGTVKTIKSFEIHVDKRVKPADY